NKEGLIMSGIIKISTAILGLTIVTSLGACVPDPYSQKNGSTTNTQAVYYAPSPPPEPMAENAPPAPGPTVYWQPGHWAWTGANGLGLPAITSNGRAKLGSGSQVIGNRVAM